MKIAFLIVGMGLAGCAAQGQLQGIQTDVTAVGSSPVAVCAAIMSAAATNIGTLKNQLNGQPEPTP